MATNEGSDILAADRNQFYQRFITLVVNSLIGSTGGSSVQYYSGYYPPYASGDGRLGPRPLGATDPASTSTIAVSQEATSNQVVTILNGIHTIAGRMARYRNTNWTYLRNPGPNSTGGGLTAMNNSYGTTLAMPTQINAFQVGQPIQFQPHVDDFMNALRSQLAAFRASNPVSFGPYCHTSCHTSCHGARGRR